MTDRIKVLILPDAMQAARDGEVMRLVEVTPDLSYLQGAVGGFVEVYDLWLDDERLTFWMNDEGRINGLEHNGVAEEILYRRTNQEGEFFGPIVATGLNGEEVGPIGPRWSSWLTQRYGLEF